MAAADGLRRLWRTLRRRKVFSSIDIDSGNLQRCLTRWDLTALGVGSTLGVGAYVIVGNVARNIAGPSLVISFLLAALASFFAGLCYAEFGARVPKAGSAYIYSYVSVGEFVAFIIGWNLILEYMIGSASVARGLSQYVDSIVNGSMQRAFEQAAPLDVAWMSPYFDFFAFSVIIVLALCLSFGMRESSTVNNALSVVNVSVVLFVIIAGSVTATAANWRIPAASLPPDVDAGAGGFFPYGAVGTLQGAAVCFYGFVGFDCIATTGEEVRDPRRAIPFAIMLSLMVIFLGYFGVSTVVTMMVPYYLQNIEAPLPYAFTYVGWEWARWTVAIGATFGLCASLFGAMFPLPRIIYSMARDGLIFKFLGHVSTRRRSPVVATMLSAVLIAFMGALFRLRDLVSMMSIGTLLAYTIVAACVLILRYGTDIEIVAREPLAARPAEFLAPPLEGASASSVLLQLVGVGHRRPSRLTYRIVVFCIFLFTCTCVALGAVRLYVDELLVPMCSLAALALLLVLLIALQPRNKKELSFQVPLVPLVPCLSIFSNIYLMMMLESDAWIKFSIWVAIGIPVYFICLCMYDRRPKNIGNGHLQGNLNHAYDYSTGKSGKSAVTIVVQSPTPSTTRRTDDNYQNQRNQRQIFENNLTGVTRYSAREVLNQETQQNYDYDTTLAKLETIEAEKLQEERETQIIELLDQVLEAEEESYTERAHASELSEITEVSLRRDVDAASEASMGPGDVSPSYDVVALVHREDPPPPRAHDDHLVAGQNVGDEEQKNDEVIKEIIEGEGANDPERDEQIINEIIENDQNRGTLNESEGTEVVDSKDTLKLEEFDSTAETNLPDNVNKSDSSGVEQSNEPFIPIPPPMDKKLFSSPTFKRAHTIIVIPRKNTKEDPEEHKSHERTFSGSSFDDSVMVFGSDKQADFMNKLNTMLQNKKIPPRLSAAKRSASSSHILDLGKLERDEKSSDRQRPVLMLDLKKELIARHGKANADIEPRDFKLGEPITSSDSVENGIKDSSEEDEEALDLSMSRQDLKSKLENIFAAGGPKMLKPRLMASNPPTPEPSLQDSLSSAEDMFNSASLSALKDKTEKADTLKLQKAKFGEVLNSFKVTMAKDGSYLADDV